MYVATIQMHSFFKYDNIPIFFSSRYVKVKYTIFTCVKIRYQNKEWIVSTLTI